MVLVHTDLKAKINNKKPKSVFMYRKADWSKIREELATGFDSFFPKSP
jgi:hypothetical protein